MKTVIALVALLQLGCSYPTKPTDHAKVARELVHKATWAPIATISTDEALKGYPMNNVISIADSGLNEPSTGIIYSLIMPRDYNGKDIPINNRITTVITDEQDLTCSSNDVDPMEPTCARVILSGKMVEIKKEATDYQSRLDAFLSRHPAGNKWLEAHEFVFYKLDIENIIVLDWYGGGHQITPEEYYRVQL